MQRLRRALVPVAATAVAIVAPLLTAPPAQAQSAPAQAQSATAQALCIAHHPQDYVWYTHGCTGHDEPELDPLSDHAGSARDLTWRVQLPGDARTRVDSVTPTFWIGGTVSDPHSLYGQAFLELQFYPNSLLKGCGSGGGYNVVYDRGVYTACSPVWEVSPTGNSESAAFNAMLTDAVAGGPLQMHAGDTITDHQYTTPQADGMHVTVTDLTTGHSGTIVLDSKADGPLMPYYSTQQLGNDLGWGLVDDAPNSLVWEIGHTGNFTTPAGQFCLPGSATKPPCYSYDVPTWLGFNPLQVASVTFGDGSSAQHWASVSDFGGRAEVDQDCGAANYGTPFCWYPWYSWNSALGAFTYGGDYPGTRHDFGQGAQFQESKQCPGPRGPDTMYCSTVLQ